MAHESEPGSASGSENKINSFEPNETETGDPRETAHKAETIRQKAQEKDRTKAAELLPTVEQPPTVPTDSAGHMPGSQITEQAKPGYRLSDQLKTIYTLFAKAWRLLGKKQLPPMEAYVDALVPESPEMKALRLETQELGIVKRMRSECSEATFLKFLIELSRAKNVLEVGTFTGYGTLAMAQALPTDGTVTTCDISEKWPAVGRKYWQNAGVKSKIDFRVGQAADSMRALLKEKGHGSFDLIFIDANKDGYDEYFELALQLVRKGGIVAIDNTLWGGLVADQWVNDKDTTALKALNQKISRDPRVSQTIIPGWDGLTLAIKK